MKKILALIALLTALCLSAGCAATGTSAEATPSEADTDGVHVTFSSDGITASSSDGLLIDGTALTVAASGVYRLSGSCENGSVTVEKGVTGVRLVLSGLSLTAEETAPILCAKGTEVTVEAAAGTENTLADTERNNNETGSADAENAVIKCKDGASVTLCGTGTLTILAKGKNGIKSGASTNEDGEAGLTIRELTLRIDAPVNDAVNAEAALTVESGTLAVSAGDDALHCDRILNIGADGTDGPTISVTSCTEGLEGAVVNIRSGSIDLVSTDDCINAANSELSGYAFELNISGGTVNAYSAEGDGFDSNGDLTISGGIVTVWTANTADEEPLDADGTVTVSGGTVLAAGGSSGMGMRLEAAQPCVSFGGRGTMQPSAGQTSDNAGGMKPPAQGAQPPAGQTEDGQTSDNAGAMQPPEQGAQPPAGQTEDGQPSDTAGAMQPPEQDAQPPAGQTEDGQTSDNAGAMQPPAGQTEDGQASDNAGAMQPPEQGAQPPTAALLTEGSAFTVSSEDGTVLCSANAVCDASFVFFSSPDLSAGAACTLSCGDAQTTSEARSGSIANDADGIRHPGDRQTGGQRPGDRQADGQQADGQQPDSQKSNDRQTDGASLSERTQLIVNTSHI